MDYPAIVAPVLNRFASHFPGASLAGRNKFFDFKGIAAVIRLIH
jgi:hypothetical protein